MLYRGSPMFLTRSLLMVSLLLLSVHAEQPYSVASTEILVYRDGVVQVAQVFDVNETVVSMSALLLSSSVSNLLVLDQSNMPLSYELKSNNITVVTLGASKITLDYLTSMLTKKEGDLWTLKVNTPYGARITLPEQSTIIYLSDLPTSILSQDNRTVLKVEKGFWEISYLLPVVLPPTGSKPPPSQTVSHFPSQYLIGVVACSGVLGLVLLLRRVFRSSARELREEEVQVLRFIAEKGGRVLESDLRKRFLLPKTSLWRLVRRLERLGYVRVSKVGIQNEIELVKRV